MLLLSPDVPERASRVQTPVIGARLGAPAAAPPENSPEVMGDLEGRLRRVTDSHDGTYMVTVLDPATGERAALNADRRFYAASLAKLPALITLYKAAARDEITLDEEISMRASDVQGGTGVLQRGYPVGYTMTLRECAAYLIQESDNTAWAMLERRLGIDNIREELRALGAADTNYRYAAHYTTTSDVLLMLRRIADPRFTTPELSEEMLDHMTDTSYENRLPEPLPDRVRVVHKTGTYPDAYSDAGIVGRGSSSYFIIAAAEGATEGEATAAIREMSLAAYQLLADP